MIKTFEYENETSFKMSKKAYYDALSMVSEKNHMPLLIINDTFTIIQKWFSEKDVLDGIKQRSRIRKTVGRFGESLEYTTKYYFKNSRMEINSRISKDEYIILDEIIYRNEVEETKIRSIFTDSETGLSYSADIYKDKDFVTIEIEFADQKQKESYNKPEWLIELK